MPSLERDDFDPFPGPGDPPGTDAPPPRPAGIAGRPLPAFPLDYGPSVHETRIEEFFRDRESTAHPSRLGPDLGTCFICYANRSGSNLLGEALFQTGLFHTPSEYLNFDEVIRASIDNGFNALDEYLMEVKNGAQLAGRICLVKLAWEQLYYLARKNLLEPVFGRSIYVHIRRRDVLGQAISFSIAEQTQEWTRTAGADAAPDRPEPQLRPADIVNYVRSINQSLARFRDFFAVFAPRAADVVYEDFEADIAGTTMRLASEIVDYLGNPSGSPPVIRPDQIRLRKQRTDLNARMAEQFRRELRAFASS
ncbi:MAG: hypothetical protein IT534_09045 [Bauldia sp.]|nr:hypothetical protein [Bauldia sp.]